jgi:hypothetical protein
VDIDFADIMTRHTIIERPVKAINQLPEEKAEEILDFACFVMKRHEEKFITKGITEFASSDKSFIELQAAYVQTQNNTG